MLHVVRWIGLGVIGLLFTLVVLAVTVTGCSPETEKSKPVINENPEWNFKTEGRITTSPVRSGSTIYFGSDDGNLYAVDESFGTLNWKFTAGGPIRSTVAIADDIVYFLSHDGVFHALDTKTGVPRWTYSTGSDIKQMDEWDYYDSSPEISNGVIYFGSSDRQLYALDARSGAKHWSYETVDVIKSSPTSDDQSIYVGDWSGYIYAINKKSGQLTWKFKTDGNGRHVAIQSKPVVSGDALYVAARDFKLYSLNKTTGQLIWKQSKPAWVGSPLVMDGMIYVGNSNGYFMEAIDAKTGVQIWVYSTASNVLAAPVIHNGTLYFGSGEAYSTGQAEGFLYAVEMETGKEVGKLKTDKIQSTPIVNGTTVYYTSFDGSLYAVNANSLHSGN